MRQVDTNALGAVAAALGVGNPATATQPVDFDDGQLQQALVVNPLVRRGRAPVLPDGIFGASILNTHAIAGTQTGTFNPWTLVAGTNAVAGWPSDLRGYDVWLLSATVVTTGATGVFTDGLLEIASVPAVAPVPPPAALDMVLEAYDTETTFVTTPVLTNSAAPGYGLERWKPIRIPRNLAIRLTTVSTAAATYRARLHCFIGPSGLGQDALGGY